MFAQTYDQLWKSAEKAMQDDLPKTAQKHIDTILKKAQKEDNMPQMCSALFTQLQLQEEISPDSLAPCKERIVAAKDKETRPVEKALYCYLLGRINYNKELLDSAFVDIPLLARTKATDYLPLFNKGKDSEWLFGDDLLSVMVDREHQKAAAQFYKEQGNMAAYIYLCVRYRHFEHEADSLLYPVVKEILADHPELLRINDVVEYLNEIEQVSLNISIATTNLVYVGQEIALTAEARNLKEANVRVGNKNYTFHFADTEPWETRHDTIKVTFDQPGNYKVMANIGGKNSVQDIPVSNVKPIVFGMPQERCRMIILDAATGKPLSNTRLVVKKDKSVVETLTPDKDGFIYIDKKYLEVSYPLQYKFYPQAGSDTYHPVMDRWLLSRGYYREPSDIKSREMHIMTDRNIYRPGQEVHFTVLNYKRHNDTYNIEEGDTVEVILEDADNKELESKTLSIDEFGVATGTFTLPKVCKTGHFSLHVRKEDVSQWDSFSVEEYKRPTFRIELEEDTHEYVQGDTAIVRGRVVTYNDIPLANLNVWNEHEDTVMTDADGRFEIPVVVDAPTYRWWSRGMHVNITTSADNGEMSEASMWLYVRWRREDTPKKELTFWEKIQEGDLLFRDIVIGAKVKSERVTYKKGMTFDEGYQEEYGDGANIYYAFVHEGNLNVESKEVKKPEPNKHLTLIWSTFRNLLVPGQQEEWTLRVLNADGTPAKAQVMARLYDGSLDAFADNSWRFSLSFQRVLGSGTWSAPKWWFGGVSPSVRNPYTNVKNLQLTTWKDYLTSYYYGGMGMRQLKLCKNSASLSADCMESMCLAEMAAPEEKLSSMNTYDALEEMDEEQASNLMPQVALRENFQETAFFMPRLQCDANGEVKMAFTLPDCLTEWHFSAFAHDKEMNFGLLNDTITARKLLQAEWNAPRFLRLGDKTEFPATITNLTESQQDITVNVEIRDAKTDDIVARYTTSVQLAAGGRQTVTFPYEVKEQRDVLLRITATTSEYSDGEQRLLPVFSDIVEVIETYPFSVHDGIVPEMNPKKLFKLPKQAQGAEYSVETYRNALEAVREVLQPIAAEKCESSISWAVNLYCSQIVALLQDSLESASVFRDKAVSALQDMQNSNGGWCWFDGMKASRYITTEIATLIARLETLVGKNEEYDEMLDASMGYLEKEIAKDVDEMKAYEKKYKTKASIYESHFHYLYLCALRNKSADSDMRYLLDKIEAENHNLSMYGKAGCSVILLQYGKKKLANKMLNSLVEHTVCTEDMGRYFDTQRALCGWRSYKIPTQTFAIEGLVNADEQGNSRYIDEMRLWLLQSKRAQKWETSLATVDACYAILHGDTTQLGKLQWGCAKVKYSLPMAYANKTASELHLERHIDVPKGGFKVGQRVKVKYTIRADRDMDFVCLTSSRAACMEPTNALSGYNWFSGAYRSVYDDRSEFYFEHLAKGTHEFEEEMFIDRAGHYACGIAKVECVYAPEFRGQTSNFQMTVAGKE